MKNGLTLKVYDVDYSFIIKNYLDEKLWEKEWTIFIYKNYHIILRLSSINVRQKVIWFEVEIQDGNPENKSYWTKSVKDSFKYFLSTESIDILKKSLNHTIFTLMQHLEEQAYIKYTDEYQKLIRMGEDEDEKLEKIANDFLDSEGVTNEDIREAYIGYYVDENRKASDLQDKYIEEMKYKMITDFYLIFLQATKDEERIKIIENRIGKETLQETLEEIKEYEEYIETEEFEEEMKEKLEDI